jgi:methanogenic corrinoid protein MtbC1
MKEIGDFWNEGSIRILHEHMASAVVRTFLGDLLRSLDFSREAPRGVATTMSGDRHELGALTAAVAAALEGWHIEYLGPNLPWEEMAQAAELSNARVVMISIILCSDEGRVLSEIDRLRSFLPAHVVILVGGRLPAARRKQLEKPGVEWIDTIHDLRLRLHSLYTATSHNK